MSGTVDCEAQEEGEEEAGWEGALAWRGMCM